MLIAATILVLFFIVVWQKRKQRAAYRAPCPRCRHPRISPFPPVCPECGRATNDD